MRLLLTALALGVLPAAAAIAGDTDTLTAQEYKEAREHYRKGEALLFEEAFAQAAAEFRMATRVDPGFTLAYYGLGQASMLLKRYEDAVAAYEACRDTILDLSSLDVREKGELRQRRYDELLDIEAVIRRWGGPDAPPNETTMKLEQRRDNLEHQQDKELINIVRVPPELSLALGSAYFRLGRLEDAEREYLAAIEGGEGTGAAQNNVAVIYMMTERYDDARAALRLAEEAGFRVNPRFKEDLKQRIASAEH
jgi:tetratricopeptide (TPR) repeat protein